MTGIPLHSVRLDRTSSALIIEALTIAHPAVTTEALRWTTGARGTPVPAEDASVADLTAYAEQALIVGTQAIAAAGGTQDTYNLEQLIQDVGTRTVEASAAAATATGTAMTGAADSMRQITAEVSKALREANDASRETFTATVTQAKSDLQSQVRALVGGEDPQLVTKLDALLVTFSSKLTDRTDKRTTELFEKATRALDPADPTSPLARHQRELAEQQAGLTTHLNSQHEALLTAVDEIRTSLATQKAASEVAAKLASVTPLKGGTFEARVHAVMQALAVGLGDEYAETGTLGGLVQGSRKGDGVLTVMGGPARVVVEMHDAKARRDWTAYLEESERNRGANASIGVVPTLAQNNDQQVRVMGPRRVVVVFDPQTDDPAMMRLAIQILRVASLAAAHEGHTGAVEVAREHVAQALTELSRIQKIRTSASVVKKEADKVDRQAEQLETQLSRLLLQTQTALIEPSSTTALGSGEAQQVSTTGAA